MDQLLKNLLIKLKYRVMMKVLLSLALVLTAHFVLGQKVISSAIGSGGTTTTVDGKYYSQIIGQQSAVTGTSTNGGAVS